MLVLPGIGVIARSTCDEAIQLLLAPVSGLLRFARNDEGSSRRTSSAGQSRRIRARSVPPAAAACGLPARAQRSARRAAGLALTGRAEWRWRAGRAGWLRRARPADRD